MFLYNFAGHETSGNTLTYSIALLSTYPEWQEWVAQEIKQVLGHHGSNEDWAYRSFPDLKRCLAVMLETLRLFSPIIAIPKHTKDQPQALSISGKTYTIPEDTMVMPNVFAMQTSPQYWGKDSLLWRPSRWIISEPSDTQSLIQPPKERIFEPQKGTFFPWSGGARVCVGRKFSQVEFVATLATLLQHHRVKPVIRRGESIENARKRILDTVNDSYLRLLLQIRHPNRVAVEWVRQVDADD